MNIRTKIILPIGVFCLGLLASLFVLLVFMRESQQELNQLSNQVVKVNEISGRIYTIRLATDQDTLSYRFEKDRKYLDNINRNHEEIASLLKEVKSLVSSRTGQELLAEFEYSRDDMQHARDQLIMSIQDNDEEKITQDYYIWQIKAENNFASLVDFTNYSLQALDQSQLLYNELVTRLIKIGFFNTLATTAFIAGLFFYLRQSITIPVQKLSVAASKIARGQFGMPVKMHTNDELGMLGQSLEEMSQKLKDYYKRLQNEVKDKEDELKRKREFEVQKDMFLSIASHELKTPVTSLKLYSQFLRQLVKKNQHFQYDRHLQKIDSQLTKITGLISSLLDVSKIQTGQLPLNIKEFNLNTCLKDSVEVAEANAPHHQIILKGKARRKLFGDEGRVCQVIDNLIGNAIKYSPQGKKIIIRVKSAPDQVTVSFQDYGIGIDARHHQHIFDRFFRISDDDEKKFPGLGLGLYVSAEIIHRHRGRIWVDSQKGQGSTFYFSLPVSKSPKR